MIKKTNYGIKLPKTKYLLNVSGKRYRGNTLFELILRFLTKKVD